MYEKRERWRSVVSLFAFLLQTCSVHIIWIIGCFFFFFSKWLWMLSTKLLSNNDDGEVTQDINIGQYVCLYKDLIWKYLGLLTFVIEDMHRRILGRSFIYRVEKRRYVALWDEVLNEICKLWDLSRIWTLIFEDNSSQMAL